jgi:hypothetical protein
VSFKGTYSGDFLITDFLLRIILGYFVASEVTETFKFHFASLTFVALSVRFQMPLQFTVRFKELATN